MIIKKMRTKPEEYEGSVKSHVVIRIIKLMSEVKNLMIFNAENNDKFCGEICHCSLFTQVRSVLEID